MKSWGEVTHEGTRLSVSLVLGCRVDRGRIAADRLHRQCSANAVLEFAPANGSFPVKGSYAGGRVILVLGGPRGLYCYGSSGQGEITSVARSTVEITYTECSAFRRTSEPREEVEELEELEKLAKEGLESSSQCHSAGALEGEIKVGPLEAELAYADRENGEVDIVLNPGGGTYLAYECENEPGELVEGRGAIAAPVTPINQEITTLTQAFSFQDPFEYENIKGEFFSAIPTVFLNGEQSGAIGVEAVYGLDTAVPIEIKAGTKPENIGASHGVPRIEGSAAAREQLTCWHGLWNGTPTPTYSYEWFRNGAQIGDTTSTYAVQASDQGDTLTCEVTARNDIGEQDATSPGVSVAQAPPSKAGEVVAKEEAAAKKKQEEEAASKAKPPGPVSANVSLEGSTISVQRGGKAEVELICNGACAGKLTLTARGAAKKRKEAKVEVIGTAAFSLPAGGTATVKLTLDPVGRSLLKADRGKLSASIAILESSPAPSQTHISSVRLVEKVTKARMKKR